MHKFWAGKVVQATKVQAMLAAKIALNTNHYAGIGDVNKRTFELGGMGAFQLTDNRPRSVSTLRSAKSGDVRRTSRPARKVEYYLARPVERQQIAAAAARRAHRDHTFEKRLEVLLRNRWTSPGTAPAQGKLGRLSLKVPAGNPKQHIRRTQYEETFAKLRWRAARSGPLPRRAFHPPRCPRRRCI